MRRYKSTVVLIIIIYCSFILMGCWNNISLSDRALIVGVGLDISEDGQIEYTMQIVNPSLIRTPMGGGTEKNAVWVHTSKGETVFEAIRNQYKVSNKRSFFSHIQVIVIGEELARKGITDALDFFKRNHETRLTANILIAKDTTAQKILRATSDLEQIPAIHLRGIIENHRKSGDIQSSRMLDVMKLLSNNEIQPTISVVEIVGNTSASIDIHNIRIRGSGVFREDKLIGWLESEETLGLLYIKDLIKSGILSVPNPSAKDKIVTVEAVRSYTKKDVRLVDNSPEFFIKINALGSIAGQEGLAATTSPDFFQELEKECEKKIESIVLNTVEISQKKYNSDIMGLGELLHIEHPKYWKEVQEDWPELFSRVPVHIEVVFTIQRTGRISTPI